MHPHQNPHGHGHGRAHQNTHGNAQPHQNPHGHPDHGTPFNPQAAVKKMLRESRTAYLSTLRPGTGDPFASFVTVATSADGSPLFRISTLAWHTQNILADNRVSLMLEKRKGGHPLRDPRVTLMGAASITDDPNDLKRYIARQPGAERVSASPDFALYKMAITDARIVEDFGRIANVKPKDILTKFGNAKKLVSEEASVIAHMNEDHAETCRLFATKLIGAPDGEWKCVGCDPEGLDLQLGFTGLRLQFPKRVRSGRAMRMTLIELAKQARAA
jgi:hypothetical protein